MAEMVGSAVVQGAVSQIVSDLIDRHQGKEKSKDKENLERLEMAHIKLGAALEVSEKWQITQASLLRWRKNLKRAAQECDETLHKCKHRVLEEQKMEQEVSSSAFPKRMAHATKSFISSAFGLNTQLSRSIVRRFEWYADGASDFLRFIELGCTPRCHMPFNPFVKNLFTGMKLQHKIDLGNQSTFFFLWLPFTTPEHGIEVALFFVQKDGRAPENSFYFSVALQLLESTDIVGIAIDCLKLYTPLFKSKVEIIRNKLMQLPTQDLSWVPFVDSHQKKHCENIHHCVSQWHRPNASCCKQLDQHELHCSSNTGTKDISLESVIGVYLQCQVSLRGGDFCLQDSQYLIAGLLFAPHSEGLLAVDKSSAIVVNHSEEQHCAHTDITLAQLEEITLPKAVEYFCQNTDALVYQMLWKSAHGAAYIRVAKASTKMQSTRQMTRGSRARKAAVHRQDQELENQPDVAPHFLNLWGAVDTRSGKRIYRKRTVVNVAFIESIPAVTTVLWQCRTRVVISDPEAPSLLFIVANVHKHVGAKDGYYGNCVTGQLAIATNGLVANGAIVDIVKMIRRAKEQITEQLKANDGDDMPQASKLWPEDMFLYNCNLLSVSSMGNIGLDDVEVHGRKPVRVMCRARVPHMTVPSCVVCLPWKGKDGANMVTRCVREEYVEAFHGELARFT